MENPLVKSIEMKKQMNEYRLQMTMKVRDFDMIKYPNIHHAKNDNEDRRDLNKFRYIVVSFVNQHLQ